MLFHQVGGAHKLRSFGQEMAVKAMHPNMAIIRSRVYKPGTSDLQELSSSGQVVIASSVQLVLAMCKATREQRHRNGTRLMIGG